MEISPDRVVYKCYCIQTTILHPRLKKVVFNDNRGVDEALQRKPAAAARSSKQLHCKGIKRKKRQKKVNIRIKRDLLFGGSLNKEQVETLPMEAFSRCSTGSEILH